MSIKTTAASIALLATLHSRPAFGEEWPVGLQLNQNLLRLSRVSEGRDARESATTPDGLEVVVKAGRAHLHFFPVDIGAPFQLGYEFFDSFEAGIVLGRSSVKEASAGVDEASTTFGIFVSYAVSLAPLSLELGLASEQSRSRRDAAENEASSRERSWTSSGVATLVVPISGRLSYLASVSASREAVTNEADGTKARQHSFDGVPVGMRLEF